MRAVKSIMAIVLLCCSISTHAIASPVDFLEEVANRVIHALNQNKSRLNEQVAYNIVNKIMLPHVDVIGMSRSVLGRNIWESASAQEKNQFSFEFTKLVVKTYSKALSKYTNEKIKFYPIRSNWAQESRVQVKSVVTRSGGPAIPISYRLIKKGNDWKVYDLSVEGVSLVASYRSQFANEIRGGGMRTLISKLKQQNEK